MTENHEPRTPATEPESPPAKRKSSRFAQVFWLSFLVVSLGYAWYCFYAPSNGIAWAASYTTAQQRAVESDKPMILFFTGAWCSPCQIMKREVWADEQVMVAVNEAFVPVTIDVDHPDATATLNRYGVGITPTTLITDPGGNVLHHQQGRVSKADFLELIGELDPSTVEGLSR